MFSFISKWFDKLNRPQGQLPQAPKGFQSRKKSIFLNRYAGLVYFIAVWHAFGYVIVSGAKRKAESEGLILRRFCCLFN